MRPSLSACFYAFHGNHTSVDKLFQIHGVITGGVQGRGKNLTPALLKSSIVFICASWETFIEEICQAAIKILLDHTDDARKIPNGIRSKIAQEIKQRKNPLDLWDLSGNSWKDLVRQKTEQLCDGTAGGLNTPNYKNISSLFKDTLGISSIKDSWCWQGMTPDSAVARLNKILQLRGSIAHGKSVKSLNIGMCKDYSNHIERLVSATCDAIDKKLDSILT